ncbi:tetratricopeptide repeat protein [Bacillus gaemokensis]|uniref:Histidine kinase n=1 Tax=Bacillus gaemokensis TaxID=574375 RepID=A0A073KGI4_9BACI|nr:tetratricopeptide repeat protein [Bacillus gaemokensis]KEK25700.1 histidine kinase [Bacillus gaemokensis]KYG38517.1 histidine kinase [Bacillus gaemokensis]
MSTPVVTKEQIKHSLDTWYQSILKQDFVQSKLLKEEIESNIINMKEESNILFYHSLLDFRYKVLTDSLSITVDCFNKIDSFSIPEDALLTHYYHLFKGIHLMYISNYNESKNHFEKAEKLLQYVPHVLEKAEFYYRFAYLSYQSYQTLLAIDQVRLAKAEYEKHSGYETCIALCENIFAMSCIDLKQFEQAEESLTKALDVFKKINMERFTLMVRNNLGLLYANQNLSESAIRHLSEVTKQSPKHFRAIYLEADEYLKLGEHERAEALIEKGLHICNQLKNQEYQYRFMILKEMNTNTGALEKAVLAGISYFEKEKLFDCIEEYTDRLAEKFYHESNHEKASEYYHMSKEARQKQMIKGALK